MKKFISLIIVTVFIIGCTKKGTNPVVEDSLILKKANITANCNTIQSGLIKNSSGTPIKLGFDQWGYNYQAFMFNGKYCDAYQNAAWCQDYKNDNLIMKWNEAWISNKDCDGDGKLDRHFGFASYVGSGAWLTNHQSGVYTDANGNEVKWTYFCKIVAVPSDATLHNGIWLNSDGTEIGPSIWGDFATIQEIYNDPGVGAHGRLFVSPDHAGLGRR